MSLPLVVRPLAATDIEEVSRSFEAVRPGLGVRFVEQLERQLGLIEAMPELYGCVWQDVRAARVDRFQHALYSVVRADRVEVIVVVHGGRDPSTWHDRV